MRNYADMKEAQIKSRLKKVAVRTIYTGLIMGMLMSIFEAVMYKDMGFGWRYALSCILLGIAVGILIHDFIERQEWEIASVARDVKWDIQILLDQKKRLEKEIAELKTTLDVFQEHDEVLAEELDEVKEEDVDFVGEENRDDEPKNSGTMA